MSATKQKKSPPRNVEILKQRYFRIPAALYDRLAQMAQKRNLVPSDQMRRSQVNIGMARLVDELLSEAEENE